MILGIRKGTADRVVEILGSHGPQTVENIVQKLKRSGNSVSPQGVYRVLRKLQENNIVIKQKTVFSLHISWLLDLSFFSDHTQEHYFHTEYIHELIPQKDKEKRIWRFTSLLKMMDFSSQLLLSLATTHQKPVALRYTPHAWEAMIEPYKAARFSKQYLEHLTRRYIVIGGQTYLDKYTHAISETADNNCVYLAQGDECIERDRAVSLDIVNEYILTTTLDAETAAAIDTLYSRVQREEDMYLLDIFRVFSQSTKIKMTLRKDKEKTRRYRRRFENLFGPLR